MIAVLCGGVGAAKFLSGLVQVAEPSEITAIVNVADDFTLHGLSISPDLDTVTYTLAGAVNTETGWGLAGETWQAMETLRRYGGEAWFNLGDRDLGTHLYRTQALSEGHTLTEVTAAIATAWGLALRLLPATDERVRTIVTLATGEDVSFQDYFVRLHHDVGVSALRYDGADAAEPTERVLEALDTAERVIIAPSNPLLSIEPVLAIAGLRDAVTRRRADCIAISPLVAGQALKGPADRLLADLGHESSARGVARIYRSVAATLVIDEADASLATQIVQEDMRCVVAPTVMSGPAEAAALAKVALR